MDFKYFVAWFGNETHASVDMAFSPLGELYPCASEGFGRVIPSPLVMVCLGTDELAVGGHYSYGTGYGVCRSQHREKSWMV